MTFLLARAALTDAAWLFLPSKPTAIRSAD